MSTMQLEKPEKFEKTERSLGSIHAIPFGEGREFQIEEETIAIFRTRTGAVYATQAYCPHREGPLADGLIGGTTIVCPFHGWKFNLSTGEAIFGYCNLKTYPVRLSSEGEILLIV